MASRKSRGEQDRPSAQTRCSRRGAHDLRDFVEFSTAHGFEGAQVLATLEDYNQRVGTGALIGPGRGHVRRPLDVPPWYVFVAQSAVTATYRRIHVDAAARVLATGSGTPIPGLLAAGVDVGDAFRATYGGGLALAGCFAMRAMRTAGYVN